MNSYYIIYNIYITIGNKSGILKLKSKKDSNYFLGKERGEIREVYSSDFECTDILVLP